MPANLSPEYKAAQAALRQARDPSERLHCLREMLRVIPKQQGNRSSYRRLKRTHPELAKELERPRRKAEHAAAPRWLCGPEGAAQIALLGPPNAGKSTLHARLTGSNAHAAAYPFTTSSRAGMMPHEYVHFQLVDLPAVLARASDAVGSRAHCRQQMRVCWWWI
jgi:ribosome-interacting GTPase 1